MAERTEIERKSICFIWKIENFRGNLEKDIESPTLYLPELGGTRCKLKISMHSLCNSFSISFQRKDLKKTPIELDIEISLFPEKDPPISLEKVEGMTFRAGNIYSSRPFIIRDEVIEWNESLCLPKDTFTLCYRICQCEKDLAEPIRVVMLTQIGVVQTTSLDWTNFKWFLDGDKIFNLNQPSNKKEKQARKKRTTACLYAKFLSSRKSLSLQLHNIDLDRLCSVEIEASILNRKGDVLHSVEKKSSVSAGADIITSSIEFPNQGAESIESKIQYGSMQTLRLKINLKGIVFNEIKELNYGYTIPANDFAVETQSQTRLNTILQNDHRIQLCDVYQSSKSTFQSLYEEQVNCDCMLRAEGQIIPVHKAVLSVRSPIFKAMFESAKKNETSNTFELPAMDAHTLHRMVLFVYLGEVNDLEMESAHKLYIAADTYQLLALKQKCFSFMKSNLSVSSACDGLLVADKLQNDDLKTVVIDFILDHNEILSMDKWNELKENYPKLAADTLQVMFKRIRYKRK